MSKLTPLTYQLGDEAALFIDETCSADALHVNAEARLESARAMLETIARLDVASDLHRHDLVNIAQAAQVLAADASDLFEAAYTAGKRDRYRPMPTDLQR